MLPPGVTLDYHFDPLEALRRWPAERPVVMLHSGRFEAQWSHTSILAEPIAALTHTANHSAWVGDPAHHPAHAPPLTHDPLRDFDAAIAADPETLYVGHLGYDLARVIERLPQQTQDDHGWPDLQFHRCPNYLIFDHAEQAWRAVGPNPQSLPDLSDPKPGDAPTSDHRFTASVPTPERSRAQHEAAVKRGLDYIAAGDLFQVNLAHRFTADFHGSTRGLFLRLADVSPAWYGAYLELLEHPHANPQPSKPRPTPASASRHALCSTSPELFLKLDADGRVTARPIKGTRPITTHPDELLHAEKDAAELNMIIDLLRSDLGRVCDYGSVRVAQPRTVESHPTVHHGVATITGKLHPSRSLRHLLRAAFPGGSITGAPKVRAMQVIEELEPVRRGPYCGAVGYALNHGGKTTACLNIAIRTLLADRVADRVSFSVGGGIVADSTPADEYQETLHKAAAMLEALRPRHPLESDL